MKQKVSDYIADYIAEWGIRDVFTVTGGGAMHMNDAFGHHPKLHCTYQHHEQACAMAAEAYARMDNRMAAVCVTTGPGATNAITGVLGGWMDSIPMLVFSGQARYATTVAASGLKLRSMGVQECNIVPVVTSITKYAQMIIHPEDIRYHLEKALYMAVNGRPGPVWLDIPSCASRSLVFLRTDFQSIMPFFFGQLPRHRFSSNVISGTYDNSWKIIAMPFAFA